MIDKTTVKELDLNRYLGTWYEIARFPHSFEKNLVGVTATYHYNARAVCDAGIGYSFCMGVSRRFRTVRLETDSTG